MKYPKFEFYQRPNGRVEFIEFLENLPQKDQQKLLTVIRAIENQGLLVSQRMEWVKKIDSELFEIRSKVSSNIQRALYFHVVGNRYVITHGFTKKTQKTPEKEISHARKMMKEFKERENDNS